jgi:hypothetical protein
MQPEVGTERDWDLPNRADTKRLLLPHYSIRFEQQHKRQGMMT